MPTKNDKNAATDAPCAATNGDKRGQRADDLIGYDELARRLDTTRRGAECLVRRRVIPCVKLGHRTVRFSWPRVLEAIAKREVQAV